MMRVNVAKTLFFDYRRQHNLRIKVVRIFNTYGPRMHPNDDRVVSNFIMQALGGDITIYGDGSQTYRFCYVEDLIEGMTRTMNIEDDFIGPVNISNSDEFSMLELANKIIALTESSSSLLFGRLPVDDPKQRQPDIDLAKKVFDGWVPSIELTTGLGMTIKYFKN